MIEGYDIAQDKVDAYCDALTTAAEPLAEKSLTAYGMCLSKSTELGWFSEWSKLCERELGQIKPEDYPTASEIRGESNLNSPVVAVEPPRSSTERGRRTPCVHIIFSSSSSRARAAVLRQGPTIGPARTARPAVDRQPRRRRRARQGRRREASKVSPTRRRTTRRASSLQEQRQGRLERGACKSAADKFAAVVRAHSRSDAAQFMVGLSYQRCDMNAEAEAAYQRRPR
jgi:hypothetical protein